MVEKPVEVDLREIPRRPFGVYVLSGLLLVGVVTAALEIARVHIQLVGFLAQADEFLVDRSGFVQLAARLFPDPSMLTIVNGSLIAIWTVVIIGLWQLQRWAWLVVMISTGITLIFALWRYFEGTPDFLGMLINVAVVFYLNDRSVQRAYARRRPGAQP